MAQTITFKSAETSPAVLPDQFYFFPATIEGDGECADIGTAVKEAAAASKTTYIGAIQKPGLKLSGRVKHGDPLAGMKVFPVLLEFSFLKVEILPMVEILEQSIMMMVQESCI